MSWMYYSVVAVVAVFAFSPAKGQSVATIELAQSLGEIIASEERCALRYDQAAIAAFIESRVPADAMDFTRTLSLYIRDTERRLPNMSESALTAHCAQVRRVALNFQFVAE
jgi:hypothetical protein